MPYKNYPIYGTDADGEEHRISHIISTLPRDVLAFLEQFLPTTWELDCDGWYESCQEGTRLKYNAWDETGQYRPFWVYV